MSTACRTRVSAAFVYTACCIQVKELSLLQTGLYRCINILGLKDVLKEEGLMGFWKNIFKSDKKIKEAECRRIAEGIAEQFGFGKNRVIVDVNTEVGVGEGWTLPVEGRCFVMVGIKDLIETEYTEALLLTFKNTVYHELVHVRNYFNASDEVREIVDKEELTYAYWARKLTDDYMAYTEANQSFPLDKSCLGISEEDILKVFYHYCLPLIFDNETDAMLFQSFYNLGTAIIVNSIVDDEFPHRKDENLQKFHERYMYHLKKAVDECYSTKKEFEQLAEMLLKDFEILYRVIKQKSVTDFEYFKKNSRMKS